MADRNIAITQKSIPTLALNKSKVTIIRRWLVEIKPYSYENKKERKKEQKRKNERKKKEKGKKDSETLIDFNSMTSRQVIFNSKCFFIELC